MTSHVAYEVRVLRDADWRLEAIFDEEILAVDTAKRVEARYATLPVVVIQEIYDAARNHMKSRSVYRSGDETPLHAPPQDLGAVSGRGHVYLLAACGFCMAASVYFLYR